MLVCYCDIYCNDCHLWSWPHVSANISSVFITEFCYSLLSFVIHYWVLLFITEFLLSCKCAFSGITPTCNKQLHTNHVPDSMWPPTTSRILEPPDCLPGLFWGHFKRQNAASNVSDHVCSVWDCENFSKLGKSWKQKPFWPRLRKKGAGARRLPLLFSHQPMRGQHVCLSVPLNKKTLYLLSFSSYMDTHKYP